MPGPRACTDEEKQRAPHASLPLPSSTDVEQHDATAEFVGQGSGRQAAGALTAPQMILTVHSYTTVWVRCRMALQDFSPRMRLPNTAHTSRPWRIHEVTADFRLEDVWALPTPGGPGDFPRLVQLMASNDPSRGSSRVARTLWALRWKVGELLGLDGQDNGQGSTRPTLRSRLPVDLRDIPSGPDFNALPFTSLYLIDYEWAAEVVNRTIHGVMHVGWVPDQTGGYRGQ